MKTTLTVSVRACSPYVAHFATKRDAIEAMRQEVAAMTHYYKKRGYKQKGTVKSGWVQFDHPAFGCDCWIKVEKTI